ncbi:MAG: hypothetical protein Q9163_000703 [Psora crenata]
MPVLTKQKRIATTSLRVRDGQLQPQGIQAYGKISKAQYAAPGKNSLRRKLEPEDTVKWSNHLNTNKRKRGLDADDDCTREEQQDEKANNGHSDSLLSTPRKKTRTQPSNAETPTQGTRTRLEFFSLESSRTTKPPPAPKQLETPPSSQDRVKPRDVPKELQDLVDLHSSFLTALSLHYTHNGPQTPADLRLLCPTVTRTWRRRKVAAEDIRRILSVHAGSRGKPIHKMAQANPFELIDYGHGKICIELATIKAEKAHRRPIEEEALNDCFFHSLLERWDKFKATDSSSETFIAALPLHPITPSPSLAKLTPLLSKGQTRLTELKAGAIKAQLRALSATSANTLPPSQNNQEQQRQQTAAKPKDASARSSDLKSRIFAKQLHQSTLDAPLSPEAVERRSALQRVPEVAPVLESLALSAQKHCNDDAFEVVRQAQRCVSFSMPILVQSLQMSLRNPISKDEAVRCVRLLGECMPEWVTVREIGRVVGVTVKGTGLGRAELGRRIEVAIGGKA